MLLPTLSVTVIGLIAGLVSLLLGRDQRRLALLVGVAGAWIGFLAGGLVGVALDVTLGTGGFVAVIGHAGAALGALLAVGRFAGRVDTRAM